MPLPRRAPRFVYRDLIWVHGCSWFLSDWSIRSLACTGEACKAVSACRLSKTSSRVRPGSLKSALCIVKLLEFLKYSSRARLGSLKYAQRIVKLLGFLKYSRRVRLGFLKYSHIVKPLGFLKHSPRINRGFMKYSRWVSKLTWWLRSIETLRHISAE